MNGLARFAAIISALVLAAPAHSGEKDNDAPADGWGYLHAQCMQEQLAEPRNICEVGLNGEPVLAIIVSNIVRLDEKSFDPYARFTAELKRLHGLDMEPREAGPIASWELAEAAQVEAMRITRRAEKGKVAFLALSLEPERLADEPNAEEMEQMPPPLPGVTAAWQDETLTVWRTDTGCGLRGQDGKEILPALVTDPFGEAGEGCPFQVAPGYGLYAFHVERSGAICGGKGVCTEIYGPDGNLMLVADYSPNLLTVHRSLHNLGLLVTGEHIQRLWSFPERRYVSGALPFFGLGPDERVLVGDTTIRHNRVAVPFERHRSGTTEPFSDTADEYALFFLDTRRFEIVAARRRHPIVKERAPPSLAAYENRDIAACDGDAAWVQDGRTDEYLRNAYYAFDKHFRAFAGSFDRAHAGADAASGDDRTHRFARIGLHLDALVPHLARLLPEVAGPADSMALARLASAFDFETIGVPDAGASYIAYLRAALAHEMLKVGGRDAGEATDAFITSLGQLRYRLRLAEAGVADPNGDGRDAALLRDEAQRLIRNWREGVRPVAERVILDGSWHTSPGSRLRWHVREMCEPS